MRWTRLLFPRGGTLIHTPTRCTNIASRTHTTQAQVYTYTNPWGRWVGACLGLGVGVLVGSTSLQVAHAKLPDTSVADETTLREFVKSMPTKELRERIYYFQGVVKDEAGELAEAEKYLRLALVEMPDSARVLLRLGRVLQKQNRFDEAKRCFESSSRHHPIAGLEPLARQAWKHDNDIHEASNIYNQLLRKGGGVTGMVSAGEFVWKGVGDPKQASQLYQMMSHKFPDSVDCLYAVATFLHEELGQTEMAIKYLRNAASCMEVSATSLERREKLLPRMAQKKVMEVCALLKEFLTATGVNEEQWINEVTRCEETALRYANASAKVKHANLMLWRDKALTWKVQKSLASNAFDLQIQEEYDFDL